MFKCIICHKLILTEEKDKNKLKLTEEGRYLPFHGFTLVSKVESDLNKFHKRVGKIIGSKQEEYSMLDLDSLHVTFLEIMTEAFNWRDDLKDKDWKEVNRILKESNFIPRLSFEELLLEDVIAVNFKLDEAQEEQDELLQDKITTLLKLDKKRELPFHMTLAYKIPKQGFLPKEKQQKLKKYVNEFFRDKQIALSAVYLSEYFNMNSFPKNLN